MNNELHFITDLALILVSAGVITIIFKLLKQPLVLGYIVAGFLVGPHFSFFPTIISPASVHEWSEIGIIFLLFALGLEFSFKKLLSVGNTAFITTIIEILTVTGMGFLTGYLLGWSILESLFLGGMLAISSTTIIIKAFDDLGVKGQKFADITMVILILQDIVAIVMMVLLSGIAVSTHFSGMEMLYSIVKLVFFLVLWFVVGIAVLPNLFRAAKKYMNDETLLIIAIGLCFGMVVFAESVGFSAALGAFVMGSILCETVEGKHIERLIKGVKDLFGAIFFVSVGMMVDPHILQDYWGTILILTLITLVGKTIFSAGGALIAGESLQISLLTGFSLSQIGEFSFIIASVGITHGVLGDHIYGIIVAVSVITTFTTPYSIKAAMPTYRYLYRVLPDSMRKALDNYKLGVTAQRDHSDWKVIIRSSLGRTIIFSVLCFAVVFCSFQYLYPLFPNKLPLLLHNTICASITLVALAPFLYGLMTNNNHVHQLYRKLWRTNQLNRTMIVAWLLLRLFFAMLFVTIVLAKSYQFTKWVLVLIAIVIVLFIFFSKNMLHRYTRIEKNFFMNLNQNDNENKD
ncbi:MAG: cation:proton antiporter [Bacteroidales bacterium]|jgi:CPA2 family monovalent cation:H+ antiporter-2|nr:cation:proton antiporter [Bacteroidales bacterium]